MEGEPRLRFTHPIFQSTADERTMVPPVDTGLQAAKIAVGGIVLCGGRSARMGVPKAELRFGRESMLERIVGCVGSVVSPIAVVSAPGQTLPPLPAEVIVACDEAEGLGPLAGIAAGMGALRGQVEAVYVSSCDVPLLRPDFIRAVVTALGDHALAIPHGSTFHHPLAAVYRMTLEPLIVALLARGERRPSALLEHARVREIDVASLRSADPELDSLRNVNTPQDYRVALEIAGLAGDRLDRNQPPAC